MELEKLKNKEIARIDSDIAILAKLHQKVLDHPRPNEVAMIPNSFLARNKSYAEVERRSSIFGALLLGVGGTVLLVAPVLTRDWSSLWVGAGSIVASLLLAYNADRIESDRRSLGCYIQSFGRRMGFRVKSLESMEASRRIAVSDYLQKLDAHELAFQKANQKAEPIVERLNQNRTGQKFAFTKQGLQEIERPQDNVLMKALSASVMTKTLEGN